MNQTFKYKLTRMNKYTDLKNNYQNLSFMQFQLEYCLERKSFFNSKILMLQGQLNNSFYQSSYLSNSYMFINFDNIMLAYIYKYQFLFLYTIKLQQPMNRKNKEKDNNDNEKQRQHGDPIPPKFSANWGQNIRFDKIIINLCDCEYDVLGRVAKQLKFKIKKDPQSSQWDIWWTDWHVLPQTLLKMEHHQKINHFPGMFNLSRKNLLAKNLMRMRKKSPDDYNFFPLTWNLPGDYNQFKAYYQSKPKGKSRTYIVKPESMSQGKGIFLTKKIQDISTDQRCVVQRYLSKPYLIDGLKFDLRIYVLVAGVDPLKAFIYHQGLARFATETYVAPNKDNIDDICMHLTNYAINKQSEKFVFNEDDNDMSKGHKRSLTSIFTLLQEKGVDVVSLKSKINQLIVKTLISGLSYLRFQYRSCQLENYRADMCFQILGFDVILNEDLQPFILQINYTPSFSTDTPLDQNIKKNLIKDTLVLMQTTKQFKQKTVNERKQYRNTRMLTGKTTKITAQQRKEKIKLAQSERDAYIQRNMGGFTRIFPLDSSSEQNIRLMQIYQRLISIEDDMNQKKKQKEQKNEKDKDKDKFKKERLIDKIEKLPNIPNLGSLKQNDKKKSQTSCKLIQNKHRRQFMSSNDQSIKRDSSQFQQRIQTAHGLTQKQLRKVIVRQTTVLSKKKQTQRRETLTLKSIQFEGGRFDGMCQNYKQNIFTQNKRQ